MSEQIHGHHKQNNQIKKLILKGFKSVAKCDENLSKLNIFIGSNGAVKSNFIIFFKMIQQILELNLQVYVTKSDGPDALLHFGRKNTNSWINAIINHIEKIKA